ncbi:MAG: DNA topoisomerase IB [Gemmatimonadota bacterium]
MAAPAVDPFHPPEASAKAGSLRYQLDDRPGLTRHRSGRGFSYRDAAGQTIRDRSTLERIRALAIPPAWTAVWICPQPNGHLQATGRDARGRKQSRYHTRWREVRDATKYERTLAFGGTLARIRAALSRDLGRNGIPREKVLALIVQLLEATFIRIGNEEYARTNRSYGLTTLQDRHVEVSGSTIQFRFRGKSGKPHAISHRSRQLARLVQQCRDLPGQDLFQYLDENGDAQTIESSDVNGYIREIAGQEFTAKDFRTWAGTVLAARALDEHRETPAPPGRSALVAAVKAVSEQLGNTPAVCRRSYVHPAVLGAFEDDDLYRQWLGAAKSGAVRDGLSGEESAVLRFLEAIAPG